MFKLLKRSHPTPPRSAPAAFPGRFDLLWLLLALLLLAGAFSAYRSGRYCAYLATDFRGYYSSAQIARRFGFAGVYDQPLQNAFQAALPYRCPDGALVPPPLRVSVPYLPVFTALFLPLPALDFTSAYQAWSVLHLAALVFYSQRFARGLAGGTGGLRLLQWALCVPMLANLVLGQMNVLLVICLGEFVLAWRGGRARCSGLWLCGLLIKPHTLLLLLPALLAGRRWGVLAGFLAGLAGVLGLSLLLGGAAGVRGVLGVVQDFAAPSFLTAPAMMNWRALALNLTPLLPAWVAWGIAGLGMAGVTLLVLQLWRVPLHPERTVLLVAVTYAATCTVAWHANIYLLLPLLPLLLALDIKGTLPAFSLPAWTFGPPLVFALAYLARPDLARAWFGLGLLAMNVGFVAWGARRLLERDEDLQAV